MSQDSLTVTGTESIKLILAGQRSGGSRSLEIPQSVDGSPITLSQVLEHNGIVNDTNSTVYRSRGSVVRESDPVEAGQTIVGATNVSAG